MKRILIIALQLISLSPLFAQVKEGEIVPDVDKKATVFQRLQEKNIFNNLDVSVTAGSTGIGVDIATPVTEFARLRAGFDVMPSFKAVVNFGVRVGKKRPAVYDPETGELLIPEQTEEEFAAESNNKFQKLAGILTSITGQKVENNVDMICSPSFYNFKFLVDVRPFAKSSTQSTFLKNLYVTAGFYWGNSDVAKAYNTTEDMPTLFSVNMYNNLYDRLYEKFVEDPEYYLYNDFKVDDFFPMDKIFDWQIPAFGLDPDMIDKIGEKLQKYGRMGLHKGEFVRDIYNEAGEKIHSKGDPYIIEPDEDCMVKAWVKTNPFKPYLGFGYGSDLSKSKSGWGVSFDAGALFWGGSPSVITHDGTDLVHDVENVTLKVGRFVKAIKMFKVYPVINLRITKRLFK